VELLTVRSSTFSGLRSRILQILLSGLVMRPVVCPKIPQPAPQVRCIGFGPGEPCSQALSVGGAETAVSHLAVLPVSGCVLLVPNRVRMACAKYRTLPAARAGLSTPAPTPPAILNSAAPSFGEVLGSSVARLMPSAVTNLLARGGRVLFPCPPERPEWPSDHLDAVRFRTLLPRLLIPFRK
jgi:hypothetical protein